MNNIENFIEYLEYQVGNSLYSEFGNGQTITNSNDIINICIDSKNIKPIITLYNKINNNQSIIRIFNNNSLITYYLKHYKITYKSINELIESGTKIGLHNAQIGDWTINTHIKNEKYHVGIIINDFYDVIECETYTTGTVKRKINTIVNYWDYIIRVNYEK